MALIPIDEAVALSKINPLENINSNLFKLTQLKQQQEELDQKKRANALSSVIDMYNIRLKTQKLADDRAKFEAKAGAAAKKANELAVIQKGMAGMGAHVAAERAKIYNPLTELMTRQQSGEVLKPEEVQRLAILMTQAQKFDKAAAANGYNLKEVRDFGSKIGVEKEFLDALDADMLAFGGSPTYAWNVANSARMTPVAPVVNEETDGSEDEAAGQESGEGYPNLLDSGGESALPTGSGAATAGIKAAAAQAGSPKKPALRPSEKSVTQTPAAITVKAPRKMNPQQLINYNREMYRRMSSEGRMTVDQIKEEIERLDSDIIVTP